MVHKFLRLLSRLQIIRRLLLGSYSQVETSTHFDKSEIEDILRSIDWGESWKMQYHSGQLSRYVITLDRLANLPRNTRVLEIGASPFGLTFLLRHFIFEDVRATQLTNSSVESKNLNPTNWVDLISTEGRCIDNFEVRQFNLEKDPWPYENESFDLIVSCEVFEHLATDPMHVVCEAGRVLRESGRLFISTPNVMSLWKIDRLFEGLQPNVDPFYRKSVYNRHNRELTPHEIKILLKSGGFSVEFIETVNAKKMTIAKPFRFFLIRLLAGYIHDRRDIIFAMGRKTDPVSNRYPDECQLYRSKK